MRLTQWHLAALSKFIFGDCRKFSERIKFDSFVLIYTLKLSQTTPKKNTQSARQMSRREWRRMILLYALWYFSVFALLATAIYDNIVHEANAKDKGIQEES